MAAPIYNVSPQMGSDLIIVVFAVVVIGGMGSIMGAIVTGFGARHHRGPDQGVLPGGVEHGDLRHHGDRAAGAAGRPVRAEGVMERVADPLVPGSAGPRARCAGRSPSSSWWRCCAVAPFVVYPLFLMKALCFALFACAFNLLIGYGGLLSFGHALYFGWASYVCGACRQGLGPADRSSADPRPATWRRAAAARPRSPARSRSAARASTSR